MKYQSTRGLAPSVSGAEAIVAGIAPDGGLYLPESWPVFSPDEQQAFTKLGYAERAQKVLASFLPELPEKDLQEATMRGYDGNRWTHPAIVPLKTLYDNLHVMELWHGPTYAFKDLALQVLPYLLISSLRMTGDEREVVILVATSGDTGKAALEGFRDVPGTRIQVFFPENGVSEVQRLQMVTQDGSNTSVVAVKGNFDDAQNGVKKIFTDPRWQEALAKHQMSFSSANSINWGRLAPQVAYYFSSYADLVGQGRIHQGDKVNFVVPTGNFGNILAGYIARAMGLPVHRLICASNHNNVLTDMFQNGVYDKRRPFYTTNSPSMDILISSNLERLLFLMADRNPEPIRQWMDQLQNKGFYTLDASTQDQMKELFWGGWAQEEETLAEIKRTYQEYGYVADTHTAVALKVYRDYQEATGDAHPVIVASTANPFKFNKSVAEAILPAEMISGKDEFGLLAILAEHTGLKIPEGLQGLNHRPVRHQRTVVPEDMPQAVREWLSIS